jgi:hypothetical protein
MKMTVAVQRAQAEKRCIRIDPKSRKENLILDPRQRQGGTHGLTGSSTQLASLNKLNRSVEAMGIFGRATELISLRKLAKRNPRSGQDVVADQLTKWELA